MSMNVMEVRRWLGTLDDLDEVGVDDGGLCLQSVNHPTDYLEIGGIPEDDEEDDKESSKSVTILDLAKYRGVKASEDGSISGQAFEDVGLQIVGGCRGCGATLGAYNGYPSKDGYWRCSDCIGANGWENVEECNRDIFLS